MFDVVVLCFVNIYGCSILFRCIKGCRKIIIVWIVIIEELFNTEHVIDVLHWPKQV